MNIGEQTKPNDDKFENQLTIVSSNRDCLFPGLSYTICLDWGQSDEFLDQISQDKQFIICCKSMSVPQNTVLVKYHQIQKINNHQIRTEVSVIR